MTYASHPVAAALPGKPGSTMSVSRRAACASITAVVRKARGFAKMAHAGPRMVARKERCRLETACAGRLKAVVRKERYRLAMVCADLQAVARKAPARAVTANASARVRPCSLTASAAPARSFRPTVAAARKARRRIGTVHANPPLRGRFVSAPIAHGRRPRQSFFRRAAVRPLVPAACHAIPTEIARRPRSAAAARYSTATPAAVKPA